MPDARDVSREKPTRRRKNLPLLTIAVATMMLAAGSVLAFRRR